MKPGFLPKTLGGWITVILGGAAIIGGLITAYFNLETEAEAAEAHVAIEDTSEGEREEIRLDFQRYQIQQQSKSDRSDLNDISEQIADIEYNLLYGGLTADQKAFWNSRLDTLKEDKACIRLGVCEE